MRYKLSIILFIFIYLSCNQLIAQQPVQTLKGKIVDRDSKQPLPGATVAIVNTQPLIGGSTDADGKYRIEKIPVGRHTIRISFMGYEPYEVKEFMIGSGKEAELNIELKESVSQLNAVEIKATTNKEKPLNSMAMVSARQLSVEEASRYAGSLDDPSRLASSFAGVAGNFSSNGIVIRGNAPRGLQWRMEGADIPNPNHFADVTAFGAGAFTALSSQMMANSDFFTGAFPAEYGNALSGIFDLHLRNGNTDKHEHTFQIGTLGIDLSSEGPFKKGKNSSYLFNYRYSTFALLSALLPEDAGGIKYQDLCFKLNFPTQKAGTFSVWGISALDKSGQKSEKEISKWKYFQDKEEITNKSGMGAGGVQHKISLSKKSYLSSSISFSGNYLKWDQDRMDSLLILRPTQRIENTLYKVSLSSTLNYKFNARHTNRTGFTVSSQHYSIHIDHSDDAYHPLSGMVNEKNNSQLLQFFTQSKYALSDNFSFLAGIHTQYFALSEAWSIEPRVNMQWQINALQNISLGYGLHGQTELLPFYLIHLPDGSQPNKNLGFTKSHHIVLGYENQLNENLRIKVEPYVQFLFDVPVIPNSSFSLQNIEQDWFVQDSLVAKGKGRNMGIDITIERFLNKGYYFLLTGTIFQSRYKADDRIERPSRFDKGFVVNFLAGKEWKVGKNKQNILSLNFRAGYHGGDRLSPVDVAASQLKQEVVYDETRAFSDRKPDAFVADITCQYRINKKNHASVWSLQIVNVTGTEEFYGYRINLKTGLPEPQRERLILPNISYKIEF